MTVADAMSGMSPARRAGEVRKVLLSSYLGSTIEFYDFLLYATAASLVFQPVFFSGLDPLAATVASYGTFAAGYLARPLGGVIFGHFGDRVGRKRMLVVSMTVMGLSSFFIGLVPPASMIGSWGALTLVLLRIGQGVAVGGEWGGAALMALEHADAERRGFAASFTNAGAPSGAVLGTLVMGTVAELPEEQFLTWGWRIPFLLSFLLLLLGLFVRSRVSESPIFTAALDERAQRTPSIPILRVLRHPKNVLLAAFGCSASFAMQILFATFALTYGVDQGAARSTLLLCFGLASLSQVLTVLAFARLSDVLGRRPVMIAGFVTFGVLLYPIFGWLGSANTLLIQLAFFLGLTCHAMTYGPMAAFISERFGTSARYTGASVGYQLATLVGAGVTPTVLASLYAASGGNVMPLVWFLLGVCAVSVVFLLFTAESKDNDLTAAQS